MFIEWTLDVISMDVRRVGRGRQTSPMRTFGVRPMGVIASMRGT
jgi:hypothetical protein